VSSGVSWHTSAENARAAAELRRRFPGIQSWHGAHTGTWWAMVRDPRGRDRLIEALNPHQLGQRLEMIGAPSQTGAAARQTPQPPPWTSRPAAPFHHH
jgi:hypothetical protein